MADTKKAIEYYEKVLVMFQRIYHNSDHPDIVATYNSLANAYEGLKDNVKAAEYRKKAEGIKEKKRH